MMSFLHVFVDLLSINTTYLMCDKYSVENLLSFYILNFTVALLALRFSILSCLILIADPVILTFFILF